MYANENRIEAMSEDLYNEIAQAFAEQYGTVSSQLFGKPCLKKGKKAFAVFYKEEMVFKIGREEVEFLLKKYSGSKRFDPSGKNRPMKDWLQVPFDFKDDWAKLAKQAMEFIAEKANN